MKAGICVALVLACGLTGCDDGKPIVIRSLDLPSPDGAYTATLEQIDNGLGFGQGALYDEVHLRRRGEPVGTHGNPGASVVFNAESSFRNNSDVTLT